MRIVDQAHGDILLHMDSTLYLCLWLWENHATTTTFGLLIVFAKQTYTLTTSCRSLSSSRSPSCRGLWFRFFDHLYWLIDISWTIVRSPVVWLVPGIGFRRYSVILPFFWIDWQRDLCLGRVWQVLFERLEGVFTSVVEPKFLHMISRLIFHFD